MLFRSNPDCHVVLRGGAAGPNYSPRHIAEVEARHHVAEVTDVVGAVGADGVVNGVVRPHLGVFEVEDIMAELPEAAKVRIDREANRPASSSWWIGLDRETFYAEARRQAERWTGVTTPEPRA